MNPYRILGVSKDATAEQVKTAYLRLAKKFHPDVNLDCKDWADSMMREVNAAYEILGDPAKRARYDRGVPVVQPIRTCPNPADIDAQVQRLVEEFARNLARSIRPRHRSIIQRVAASVLDVFENPKRRRRA